MKEYIHKPVLVEECIRLLQTTEGNILVDGTLGLGGHSSLLLPLLGESGKLIGIDRDAYALEMAKERLGDGVVYVHGNFFDLDVILEKLGLGQANGILLDLGVSSYQLDDPARGFSYMEDGPLDMRMDSSEGLTAYHVVNEYSEEALADILRRYGEERWSRRIAKFIVERRKDGVIRTSYELVDVIKRAIPKGARRNGPHPAKRSFQAIRIEVNGELDNLEKALYKCVDCLAVYGVLCVIAFHSLEDRIVKRVFQDVSRNCSCPPGAVRCSCDRVQRVERLTHKPIVPSAEELGKNPRSRSAKLRAVRRIAE